MAQKPDAAAPTADAIMKAASLKAMLNNVAAKPLHCAIAMTKEGEGIVTLERTMRPKTVGSALISEAKKVKLEINAGLVRFGTVSVNEALDPDTLLFTINKLAGGGAGFEKAIRDRCKLAGWSKIAFEVDETLEQDDAGEQVTAEAPPAPPPPAPQQQTGLSASELSAQLAGLIKLVPAVAGTDKTLLTALSGLAAQANNAIKGGNMMLAQNGITDLKKALAAAAQPKASPSSAGPVTYGKARLAWIAARQRMVGDIEKLRAKIIEEYKTIGIDGDIDSAYSARVAPVMSKLDEELADLLDSAVNASDEAKRADLVTEARKKIDEYTQFLDAEPLIADLDDNPFVPLQIKSIVGGTLAQLSRAVH